MRLNALAGLTLGTVLLIPVLPNRVAAAPARYLASQQGSPSITGSGAPYLRRMFDQIQSAASLHIRARLSTRVDPKSGSRNAWTTSVDLAWASGSRFRSTMTGTPSVDVVSDGTSIYTYFPSAKEYRRISAQNAGAMTRALRDRVSMLSPGSPHNWIYEGVREASGHACDVLSGKGRRVSERIYLDRSTHLPWRVSILAVNSTGSSAEDATFSMVELNTPLPASLFHFTPPAGSHPAEGTFK